MRIKTLLILLSLPLFFYEHGAAQWPVYTEDIVADAQEVQPVFRGGGLHTFADWVRKQVIYFQNYNSAKGGVEMYFTVDEAGNIRDITVKSSTDAKLTKAVLKAIGRAPKMTPGTRNGKPSKFRLLAIVLFTSYTPKPDPKPGTYPRQDPTKYYSANEIVVSEFKPRFSKSDENYSEEKDLSMFRSVVVDNIFRKITNRVRGAKINITFIVNRGGYIEDVEIEESSNRAMSKIAMKVMYSLPKWHSPGLVNGKPVRVAYTLPITIRGAAPRNHFNESPPRERFY